MVSPEEYQAFLSLAEEESRRHGAEVIEIVVRGDRTRRVVELFVDSEAGVSLGLCQEISKSLIQEIDRRALAVGDYRLDVSSPGSDRPLKFPWQYRKHTGRTLEVVWNDDKESQTTVGPIVSVDDEGVVIKQGKGAEDRRVSFGSIVTAKIKTPW